jgi:HAE1 family hydrophobic/amphiphilic exporter-1
VHPIESFIRNPIKVAVGVLLVALFGIIGLWRMPMQLTPEVQTPTLTIRTRWPGASPQEIEREIVQEQEEQLKSVEGLLKLSSQSRDSEGEITLEFAVGTDMREALLKVNSRLQQVPEYPEDSDEPVISTSDASDRPIAWFILSARSASDDEIRQFQQEHPDLSAELDSVLQAQNPGLAAVRLRKLAEDHPEAKVLLPPDIDVPKLRKFAEDEIESRFERVDGVSNSNVLGGRDPEMRVIVDPQDLAARDLTIQDVRLVLRGENKDTSAGDIWEGKRRYVVRTLGQFRSPEQIENVLLKYEEGKAVRVSDVARVELGHKKPDGFVRRFGTNCIAVNALRESGANVLDVMRGLREENQRLNDTVLKDNGLVLTQVYDETEYIYSAVGLVNSNIVIGGLLTIIVLLIFLRSGRSTLVIALAIPTSIVGTFLVLHALGRSLNVISLAGLAFAVGMLVDNAVVVLENIYRRYQLGEGAFVASFRATREVWGAVVASTLTTLAVFLPVLFIQQEAGQLFRDIALAISSAVGLSLIVSVTVIPVATARILPRRKPGDPTAASGENRFLSTLFAPLTRFGGAFSRLVVGLNDWIQRSLTRRLATIGILVGTAALVTVVLWPKVEYLPTGNRNLIICIVQPPPGYNLDMLVDIGQFVENELKPYWDIDPDSPEARDLPYPPIGDFFYVARGRQVFIGLRADDPQRAAELIPLIAELRGKLPGTIVVAKQTSLFERGLTAGRTVEIEITGPHLPRLVELGGNIFGQLAAAMPEGTQMIPVPSLDLSSPELHVIPKPEQCRELGVNTADLGYTVDALVDGAYASDYFIGGDKIDLTIVGQESYAQRTQSVEDIYVATPAGKLVTIGTLAHVSMGAGPEQVNHRERQRAITIQVSPPITMPLEDAITRINTQVLDPLRESGELEGGYSITLGGTADELRNTWDALKWNLVLAVLITYLLMAALFESWTYPFVVILSVPMGAAGGVLGLQLLNLYLVTIGKTPQSLDVLTMLGFVILVGTVVNNAILIVHQSLNHMRDEGMDPRPAILESVRTRIRPIFMTTTTTVFGLAPLVFFPGAGSELYRGLGSVVLGGLVVSTIFTLFLVPAMFSVAMDAVAGLRRLLQFEPAVGELAGELAGTDTIGAATGEPTAAAAPRPAAAPQPAEPTAPTFAGPASGAGNGEADDANGDALTGDDRRPAAQRPARSPRPK